MMKDLRCTEAAFLLDRAVDDELSTGDREQLDRHVSRCRDCAERLNAYTELSRMVRDGLAPFSAPDTLRARIRGALAEEARAPEAVSPRKTRRAIPRWAIAASIALLVISNAVTFSVARRGAVRPITPSDLLASHMRSLVPGHLVDIASNNQHNVKPWFNGRAAMSPQVPFLDSLDFHLVGGRMDFVDGRQATVVVYSRRLHMINVYAWPEAGTPETESTRNERGYHLLTWRQDGIRCWVASDLNAGELEQFARAYRAAR
jgi:anti-sigma factor RsiW